MQSKDIRWKQRFNNYKKAFATLEQGVNQFYKVGLSNLEKQGIIQGFEYTHELCWKVMKDFLKDRGDTEIYGSKDATRKAFNLNLISKGETWMEMIADRNLTSHTYNEEITEQIFNRIVNKYFELFKTFEEKMDKLCLTD